MVRLNQNRQRVVEKIHLFHNVGKNEHYPKAVLHRTKLERGEWKSAVTAAEHAPNLFATLFQDKNNSNFWPLRQHLLRVLLESQSPKKSSAGQRLLSTISRMLEPLTIIITAIQIMWLGGCPH